MATRLPGDNDAEPAGKVVSLSRRPEPDPGVRQQHGGGDPVAFGVELPARPDIVFSIAALTQLITIADGAGVSATADLHRVIADLRRRLSNRNVALPAELEELVEQLTPDPGAGGYAGIDVVPFRRR